MRARGLGLVLLLGNFPACSTKSDLPSTDAGADELPPAICRKPPAIAMVKVPWFTEITSDVGLAATGPNPPVGAPVTADLDGDGFDDLLSAMGPPGREPEGSATRTRFVFMNRPSGNGRVFVDATYASGLMATRAGTNDRSWSSMTLVDLDSDHAIDAILCPAWVQDAPSPDGCSAFKNDGKGRFTLFPASDLDKDVWSVNGAVAVDVDRDGLLDWFPTTLGNWNGKTGSRMRLYKGAGDGTFVNVAAAWGLPTGVVDSKIQHYRRAFGITSCDLDGDGNMDFLLSEYGRDDNYVFLNDGAKLTEVSEKLGLAHDDGLDYSDDLSWQCWCVSNPGSCPDTTPKPPSSYCTGFGGTDGRGWIVGYSDSPHHLGGNTFAMTCGDIDDDGDLDVLTCETTHGDVGASSDRSELALNPGAMTKFVRPGQAKTGIDRRYTGINWNEGDNAGVFVDLDLDGEKDLYLASSNYPGTHGWVWRQKPDHTFEDVTKLSGIDQVSAESPQFVDVDGDGDLDLILTAGLYNGAAKTAAVRVYRNDLGQDRNWTRIRVVGLGAGHANTMGIGARVTLTVSGKKQVQEVLSAPGHSGGGTGQDLTFGLGDACEIDDVEIRWPDAGKTVTHYAHLRANYRVVITEGDPKPKYLR